MDDDDCCVGCCLGCCTCVLESLCNCCCILIALVLIGVLVPAYGVVSPVRAAVEDASLSRFALANANGTALAYDLALTVALRNRNWAMRADHAAPLDAELRFAGRRLDGVRLADGTGEEWKRRSIDPHGREEFPVLAASAKEGVELDGHALAEFARQSAVGVFEMELRLTGAFRYRPVHAGGSRRMDVTCPLKMVVEASSPHAAPETRIMVPVFDKVVRCY
ncbi:hypothetical protein PR202_gb04447 [Eleusine coracana subsp. coracana]|uniref:Late embryogenesis abundant protein LEA-2 subgroup domain-containing protein n=1 Tax=Eleusine coracana subsp. coracana TaxID=191504 RepID=A0AAV5E4K7_ELECO|nr:hypothetical protein QOZ80_1BG0087440 [Eleusine coracana subsp. coracana]GJN17385.1 hypothetical protein PR202_gb04447 [Eleusine coracana subsp. coracana]